MKIFIVRILAFCFAINLSADKEVRTCMFVESGQYLAKDKLDCYEDGGGEDVTMKSLYKDRWSLKTTYMPSIVIGDGLSSSRSDVVLVFERELSK